MLFLRNKGEGARCVCTSAHTENDCPDMEDRGFLRKTDKNRLFFRYLFVMVVTTNKLGLAIRSQPEVLYRHWAGGRIGYDRWI